MKHKIKCKICGARFAAKAENRYTSMKDNTGGGIAAAFKSDPPTLFDTFDCPECGCQHIAQIILPRYNAPAPDIIEEAVEAAFTEYAEEAEPDSGEEAVIDAEY